MNKILLQQEEIFVPLVLPIGSRDFVRRAIIAGSRQDTELHLYIPNPNLREKKFGWQVPFALLELNREVGEFLFCNNPIRFLNEKSTQLAQIKKALSDMGIKRKFDPIRFTNLKLECPEVKNSAVYYRYPALIIH